MIISEEDWNEIRKDIRDTPTDELVAIEVNLEQALDEINAELQRRAP